MGWMWVLKHRALDVWDVKKKAASRVVRTGFWLAAAGALGIAASAAWAMASFPGQGGRSVEASWSPLAGCQKALEGLPRNYRSREAFEFGENKGARLGCRQEGGVELVERFSDRSFKISVLKTKSMASMAEDDEALKRFVWLDHLAWTESKPENSWAAFAETAGAKGLTIASRGIEESSLSAHAGVWDGIARLSHGVVAIVGLILWGIAWVIKMQWSAVALGVAAAVGAGAGGLLSLNRHWKGRRMGLALFVGAAGSLGVFVGVMPAIGALGPMTGGAVGYDESQFFVSEDTRSAMALLPGCESWLPEPKVLGDTVINCEREGGREGLVARFKGSGPVSWTPGAAEGIQRLVEADLGLENLSFSAWEAPGSVMSWRVFKELAGWAEPTAASRSWGLARAPRLGDRWGREEWDKLIKRSLIGTLPFIVFLLAMIMAVMSTVVAWKSGRATVKRGLEAASRAAERIRQDPAFNARAQRRELRGEIGAKKGAKKEKDGRRL